MAISISKNTDPHGDTYYEVGCKGFPMIVSAGKIFMGVFFEGDLTPEEAIELGAAFKLAGEAAQQLKDGSTQTVLDLWKPSSPQV